MKVFATGATGFIGSALVKELIAAGHQVRGLSRSDAGAEQLKAAGAEVQRGDIKDLDGLREGARGMDAVVNLAFNHDDMSKFVESGAEERAAIQAMGEVLEPGKLLIVTSGTGLASGGPGHVRLESDPPNQHMPRNPEDTARALADRGLRVGIVRLPQVHDTRKQGLVTSFIQIARDKGVAAYVGEGSNRWAAAPLADVAQLYHRAVEQAGPGVTVYHAVQEEGVSARQIAEAVGKGLQIPVRSITAEEAAGYFGWLNHFAAFDMPASSEQTRRALNWNPAGPGLIEDLSNMNY